MESKDNKNLRNGEQFRIPLIPLHDDELFILSESEDSSSSSNHFFGNQTVVMELHGVEIDELPDNPLPEVKTRKLLKKKRPRPDQDQGAVSLTSSSEGSVVPPGPEKQEEFYDAHESYYDFPENQASNSALTALAVVASQQDSPEVKRATETTALSDATTTAGTQLTADTATGRTPVTSAVSQDSHELKRTTETTARSDATTAAGTQLTADTATGRTPVTSAVTKPVHPSNPE